MPQDLSGMSHYARMLAWSFVLVAIVMSAAPLDASTLFSHYRGVTFGDSLATVMTELKAEAASVKVLHEVPSLIQELTWRPQRYISGLAVTADPLAEIVLTFHVGQLVRIAATYDRDRVHGLTDADLHELVGAVYRHGAAALARHRGESGLPIAVSSAAGATRTRRWCSGPSSIRGARA